MIEILEYKEEDQPYFEKFNRAWIESFFELEEIDAYVLFHPYEAIIKPGGSILMASYGKTISGTVALKKITDDVFELTKMAVEPLYQRKGIAKKLCEAAIEKAASGGATKIILYSQTILKGAILLYKKLGFKEVPLEKGTYKRANIKMELNLQSIHDMNKLKKQQMTL